MVSAVKVKRKMIESGLKLDMYSHKALIHGFCKVLELDNAKEELFTMLEKGLSPGYSTYSWLVDGFYNQNKQDEIAKLPEEFEKRGLCPDIALYRGQPQLEIGIIRWRFWNRSIDEASLSLSSKSISHLAAPFIVVFAG
ncbi:Pentatricopeptide repeat-containing protein [Cardamine amara subsp. amara]|uniref:Pentatricopeptide repeat-containing protein n=1 Tax=Cardamine amara subsp. amara TaxID=228776 RepID=A0ABD1C0Q3_CARAN